MSKTTIDTITDEQIRVLAREAEEHDDAEQVLICRIALGNAGAVAELLDDAPMSPGLRGRLAQIERETDRSEARAECARVIADAEAQG